jgi:hypothetical protein
MRVTAIAAFESNDALLEALRQNRLMQAHVAQLEEQMSGKLNP